ncbi:hypothetical protein BVY00_01455 [bacterium G20]|nr:hypothetical protein BVY00_01455 [bacterium G20]
MAKRAQKFSRRTLLLGLAAVVLLGLVGFGLSRNKKPASATIPSTTTSIPNIQSSDKANKNATSPPNSEGTTNSPKSNPSAQASLPLIAPWGDFVSNHSPGKNGTPTSEVSTCNTTQGATCYIQFTKGSLSRTLESKTADGNGSVSWSWDVANAGLSSGKWQVAAVATLNGQSKTTTDQLPLEVQ